MANLLVEVDAHEATNAALHFPKCAPVSELLFKVKQTQHSLKALTNRSKAIVLLELFLPAEFAHANMIHKHFLACLFAISLGPRNQLLNVERFPTAYLLGGFVAVLALFLHQS